MISFVSPDLDALIADFGSAPERLKPLVRGVVSKGALNVKKNAQRLFEAQRVGGYLPHYSRAISYELVGDGLSAVVGPESGKPQGGMGKAIEEGTANHAPMPHLYPALEDETPGFELYLARVAEGVLE